MKQYSYSKYHNKAVTIDNIRFASMKEANRYKELQLLLKAGKIKNLELQRVFNLIPAQYGEVNGKRKCLERACDYKADFYYQDADTGEWIVEDTKGMKTKEYIIKRKLMLHVHGIRIKEV